MYNVLGDDTVYVNHLNNRVQEFEDEFQALFKYFQGTFSGVFKHHTKKNLSGDTNYK